MSSLRFSGILTVLVLWVSMLAGILSTGLNIFGTTPLSSLGVDERSVVWFSGGLIIAALSLIAFSFYLKKTYVVTKKFIIFLLIGQAGQVIAALAPYGGEQPARAIHTVAAMTLAFSIPIVLYFFAAAQKNKVIRTVAFRLFSLQVACFVVGIGGFVFFIKGAPAAQMLPAVAFHAWIFYFSRTPSQELLASPENQLHS